MEGTRVRQSKNSRRKANPAGLTYYIHAPKSAWHQATPIEAARTLEGDAAPLGGIPRPPERIRPRMGWSLAIASIANIILGSAAVVSGEMLIGIVACSGLSIATCGLVLAEISWRYRLDRHGPPAHYCQSTEN